MSPEGSDVPETFGSDDPASEYGEEEEKMKMVPVAEVTPEPKTPAKAKTIPEAIEYFQVKREHVDGQLVPNILPNDKVMSEQWNDLGRIEEVDYHGVQMKRGCVVRIQTTQISAGHTSCAIILDIRKLGEQEKYVILVAYCATKPTSAKRKRRQRNNAGAAATFMLSNAIEVFPHNVVATFLSDEILDSKHDILDTFERDTSGRKSPRWLRPDHPNVKWVARTVQAVLYPPIQDESGNEQRTQQKAD